MAKKKSQRQTTFYTEIGDDPYHDYLPKWSRVLRRDQKISALGKENLIVLLSLKLNSLHGENDTPARRRAIKLFFEQWLSEAKSKPLLPLCRSSNYLSGQKQIVFHPQKLGHPKNRFIIIDSYTVKDDRVIFKYNGQNQSVPLKSPFILTMSDYSYLRRGNEEDLIMFSSSYKKGHDRFNSRQWREDMRLNTFISRQSFNHKTRSNFSPGIV